MNPAREAFLQRVRRAVAAGNRPGTSSTLPSRGRTGYQGAGLDAVARFRDEFTAAGGHVHLVPDRATAVGRVVELARAQEARYILLGHGPLLDSLDLAGPLEAAGATVRLVRDTPPDDGRDPFFAADLGVSGVAHLIAETGSLVMMTGPDEPRSLSLLPPIHIAVAERCQILPDLFDLFDATTEMPACLTLITGPSKTGDIELRLVTGVHGPGTVHVVLIA